MVTEGAGTVYVSCVLGGRLCIALISAQCGVRLWRRRAQTVRRPLQFTEHSKAQIWEAAWKQRRADRNPRDRKRQHVHASAVRAAQGGGADSAAAHLDAEAFLHLDDSPGHRVLQTRRGPVTIRSHRTRNEGRNQGSPALPKSTAVLQLPYQKACLLEIVCTGAALRTTHRADVLGLEPEDTALLQDEPPPPPCLEVLACRTQPCAGRGAVSERSLESKGVWLNDALCRSRMLPQLLGRLLPIGSLRLRGRMGHPPTHTQAPSDVGGSTRAAARTTYTL